VITGRPNEGRHGQRRASAPGIGAAMAGKWSCSDHGGGVRGGRASAAYVERGPGPREVDPLRQRCCNAGPHAFRGGPPGALLYSRRLDRSHVIEPGRGWAYFALFSEIGFLLLATTLIGVLVGYWVGQQIGFAPIFVVIGLAVGLGVGGVGVYRLITRFLASFDD
jgi:hypothetical protein